MLKHEPAPEPVLNQSENFEGPIPAFSDGSPSVVRARASTSLPHTDDPALSYTSSLGSPSMSPSKERVKTTVWATVSLFFTKLPTSTSRDPYLKKMFWVRV